MLFKPNAIYRADAYKNKHNIKLEMRDFEVNKRLILGYPINSDVRIAWWSMTKIWLLTRVKIESWKWVENAKKTYIHSHTSSKEPKIQEYW